MAKESGDVIHVLEEILDICTTIIAKYVKYSTNKVDTDTEEYSDRILIMQRLFDMLGENCNRYMKITGSKTIGDIDLSEVYRLRCKISHHYEDVNADLLMEIASSNVIELQRKVMKEIEKERKQSAKEHPNFFVLTEDTILDTENCENDEEYIKKLRDKYMG